MPFSVQVGETLLEMILEGSNAKDTVGNSSTDGAVHSSEVSESLTEDTAPVNREEKQKVLTTPAVRNLAKTYGINLSDVVGTGKDGRITNHDVLSYVASRESVKEDIQVDYHFSWVNQQDQQFFLQYLPSFLHTIHHGNRKMVLPV